MNNSKQVYRCNDRFYMALALRLSQRAWGRCAPNPSVGAIVVSFNSSSPLVLGRGWTQPAGQAHAEIVALTAAGKQAQGATLYVTLEPCSHYGRTPPCVDAIIKHGISRVVYGIKDINPVVAGSGLEKLEHAGVEVCQTELDLQNEAAWIMRGHSLRQNEQRPFVQLKMAVDYDGQVSIGNGAPVWITGKQARNHAHLLRSQADAILIGKGTAIADNPSLTCRLPGLRSQSPIRVVLDKTLSVSKNSHLVQTIPDAPLWIFYNVETAHNSVSDLEMAGAETINVPLNENTKALCIKSILNALYQRGITRLMVEGGPNIFQTFFKHGHVDEINIFQSHKSLGKNGQPAIKGEKLDEILNRKYCRFISQKYVGQDVQKNYRIEGSI